MSAESTAARVALWRALHVEADPPPHVLVDRVGLELLAPADDWRQRGDMEPGFTRPFRASILARARFIEETVKASGVGQYVLLGAGLDSFAQRHPEPGLVVFEVDRPEPQAWKRQRLEETGYGVPAWLRFVPVDFEAGDDWRLKLDAAGFDGSKPAVVASTGVSMYLTREANLATLRRVAAMAPGSTFVMSFMLPLDPSDAGVQAAAKGAKSSGTPFISFFTPDEVMDLAREAGFKQVEHVSADELARRYFADRADGLRPPPNAEELLVART